MMAVHPHKRYEKKHPDVIKELMEEEYQRREELKKEYRRTHPKKQKTEPHPAVRFVEREPQTKKVPAWKRWGTQFVLAVRLNELIDKKKLTLEAISKETKMKKSSLSYYTAGTAEAGADAVVKLSRYLSVPTDYLLGLTNAPTTNPDKKWAIEHTGISAEGFAVLHKGHVDAKHPLYSDIVNFLLESGTLDNLVQLLEKSLISREQYRVLFEENDSQRQNVLETQEYQFNKQVSGLYASVVEKLNDRLAASISNIAEERFFDFVDGALDTKEKMEQIIDAALSDPAKLDEYNRRNQTFK